MNRRSTALLAASALVIASGAGMACRLMPEKQASPSLPPSFGDVGDEKPVHWKRRRGKKLKGHQRGKKR